MGFAKRYVNRVRECITIPMYFVAVNGGGRLAGYFSGAKGMRQRDPLSSIFFFFFLLAMEFLTQMLKKRILGCKDFKFHPRCKNMQLINLYSTRMILTRADQIPVQLAKSVWKIL